MPGSQCVRPQPGKSLAAVCKFMPVPCFCRIPHRKRPAGVRERKQRTRGRGPKGCTRCVLRSFHRPQMYNLCINKSRTIRQLNRYNMYKYPTRLRKQPWQTGLNLSDQAAWRAARITASVAMSWWQPPGFRRIRGASGYRSRPRRRLISASRRAAHTSPGGIGCPIRISMRAHSL